MQQIAARGERGAGIGPREAVAEALGLLVARGAEDAFKQLGLMHPLHAANDLSIVLSVAIVCALLMGSWSQYNRVRFTGKQRRRGNRSLDIAEMAPALAASIETAQLLRARQRSVVRFAQDGQMFVDGD